MGGWECWTHRHGLPAGSKASALPGVAAPRGSGAGIASAGDPKRRSQAARKWAYLERAPLLLEFLDFCHFLGLDDLRGKAQVWTFLLRLSTQEVSFEVVLK